MFAPRCFISTIRDMKVEPFSFCWSSSIRDSKKLNKLIKKAGSVLRTALEPLELIAKRIMLHKLINIKSNTYPLTHLSSS